MFLACKSATANKTGFYPECLLVILWSVANIGFVLPLCIIYKSDVDSKSPFAS